MPITCVVEFDNNPDGTFFAGEVVTGKVTLETKRVEKVKGFAEARWSNESHSNEKNVNPHNPITGREDYIQSTIYLMKSDTLNPGIHSYNFAYQIPITCPSSLEDLHGHIRYTVIVTIVHRWKFNDTFTRNFTVSNFEDMNYNNPVLYRPLFAEKYKTFGLWTTGSFKTKVSIPQSIYVPGQIISVDVLINNRSDVYVEGIKFALVMYICYHSQSPWKDARKQEIKVITSMVEGVQPNCSENVRNELLIPATPPTCIHLCSIIEVTYALKVKVKFKGLHADEVFCIPIIIGNAKPSTVIKQDPIINPSTSSSAAVRPRFELEGLNLGNVQKQHGYTYPPMGAVVFEEAIHMRRLKNACIPKYPVLRNIFSPLEHHTFKSNAEFKYEKDKSKLY